MSYELLGCDLCGAWRRMCNVIMLVELGTGSGTMQPKFRGTLVPGKYSSSPLGHMSSSLCVNKLLQLLLWPELITVPAFLLPAVRSSGG